MARPGVKPRTSDLESGALPTSLRGLARVYRCRIKKVSVYSVYNSNEDYTFNIIILFRSGSAVVDNTLDYQSRDHKIDPRFSGLSDETLNQGPISA